METIKTLVDRALPSASAAPQQNEKQQRGLPARIIDRVWQRMADIYGHKWTSAYGDSDEHGTWSMGLADLTVAELRAGFVACVKRADTWPPSLPEFRALCRPVKRINEAAYRFPPNRQLSHKLSDEARAEGRAKLARAREDLCSK